jgi:hypothetical protein
LLRQAYSGLIAPQAAKKQKCPANATLYAGHLFWDWKGEFFRPGEVQLAYLVPPHIF